MCWKNKLGWCAAILLSVGLLFFDNIRGYYRFKAVCRAQGGAHVSQLLERNVGWRVSGGHISEARFPLSFDEVAFVRYKNEQDGLERDVYRVEKKSVTDLGYVEKPADIRLPVIYEYRFDIKDLQSETRLSTAVNEVIDLRTSAQAAVYTMFIYSEFEPSRTLLAAPSLVTCPDDTVRLDPKNGKPFPRSVELAFKNFFKK